MDKQVISRVIDFIKNTKNPVLIIAGPTATGKSGLAIEIAKTINGYIINGDSRQVYKELVIGTAQPIPDEIIQSNNFEFETWIIDGVEHFLYGFTSIEKPLNLYEYKKHVKEIISKMSELHPNKTPIIVGGTGLYIDSVVFDYKIDRRNLTGKTNQNREVLTKLTVEQLQEKLGDKLSELNESDKKNPYRLIRLIERNGDVYSKGTPMNYLYFIVDTPIETIEMNIKSRLDKMIKDGLLNENTLLRKSPNFINSTKTIGYREFDDYFSNKATLEQTIDLIALHTRQYAKRQITWFKRHKDKENVISVTI